MHMSEAVNQYQLYDLSIRKIDPYGNKKYQFLLNEIKNDKALRILNIGSGFGELSNLLAKLGHQITNIEPSTEYIEQSKIIVKSQRLSNVNFVQSNFESFDTKDLFDLVVATDVVEHIQDDISTLSKIKSLLHSDGRAFITVPAFPWLSGNHDKKLNHFRRYTKSSLKQIIPKGLEIKSLRYFGFTLIPIAILYSKILKKYYPISDNSPLNKNWIIKNALQLLLELDARISFPIGTSLILICKRT
jgi:2-polyprenyl-3-methyl-5-hydroxy-6-metoxy-1,4-benzoquinol methylase